MNRAIQTRTVVLAAVLALVLTGCTGDRAEAPTTTPAATTSEATAAPEPEPGPLIPDDVIAGLDAAVATEAEPIATSTEQTEGLPPGATLDVLQLDRTAEGGYLLRVRLSWTQATSLTADQHRSLSLDGRATFVDGMRLVDEDAQRFTLPTVYAPQPEEQIDTTERFRCLCSDLVSQVPPQGQILSALYGPLVDGAEPDTLTLEVPGFAPIPDVPVGSTG